MSFVLCTSQVLLCVFICITQNTECCNSIHSSWLYIFVDQGMTSTTLVAYDKPFWFWCLHDWIIGDSIRRNTKYVDLKHFFYYFLLLIHKYNQKVISHEKKYNLFSNAHLPNATSCAGSCSSCIPPIVFHIGKKKMYMKIYRFKVNALLHTSVTS